MQVICRFNCYFKILTRFNNFNKSDNIKSFQQIHMQSTKVSATIASNSFQQSTRPLHLITNTSTIIQAEKQTSLTGNVKAEKDKKSKKKSKQKKEKDRPTGQKSQKTTAKQRKAKSKKQDQLQKVGQSQVKSEYPALNILENAFKVSSSALLHTTFGNKTSTEANQGNKARKQSFMSLVHQSLVKSSGNRIIRIVESSSMAQYSSEKELKEARKALTNRVRKALEQELVLTEKTALQKESIIKSILQSLKKANLSKITLQNFQHLSTYEQELDFQPVQASKIGQIIEQKLIFRQVFPQISQQMFEQSQRYGYCYNMPYDVSVRQCDELVAYLREEKGIQISKYILFPYKNFVENKRHQIVYKVPEDYKDKARIQKVYQESSIDHYLSNPAKKKAQRKKAYFNEMDQQMDWATMDIDSMTQTLLSKVKQEEYSKFNQSSMVLQLQSTVDKNRLITPYLRLFGLNYKRFQNVKLEEGPSKASLIVSSIPSGCTSLRLLQTINQALKTEHIRIQFDKDCYISKSFIQVDFQYFTHTLKAVQILNNLPFQGKKLKAQIKYGSVRLLKGGYQSDDDAKDTWKRISEVTDQYLRRFQKQEQQQLL